MFRWISCSSRTEDAAKMPEAIALKNVETESVLEGYRRWGYLAANLDPLGFLTPIVHPELIAVGEAAAAARKSCTSMIPNAAAGSPSGWNAKRRWWIAPSSSNG